MRPPISQWIFHDWICVICPTETKPLHRRYQQGVYYITHILLQLNLQIFVIDWKCVGDPANRNYWLLGNCAASDAWSMYGKHLQQRENETSKSQTRIICCTIAEKFDWSICRLFDWIKSFVFGFSLRAHHFCSSTSKVENQTDRTRQKWGRFHY